MPPLDKSQTIGLVEGHRVSAIIRTNDASLARSAMRAAVEGGFRMVEFTLTIPDALDLISEFAQDRSLLVGAGTVMSPEAVDAVVEAGASFIVSPITDGAVIARAAEQGAVSIPGAATPTEMQRAWQLGADFVKVFPEPAGGVEFIRAVRGPMPHLKLFPTAGPTPDNFLEYLSAGCSGVGFVKSLFVPKDLADKEFGAIRSRAKAIISSLANWSDG